MRTRSTPRRILRALPAVAVLLAAMPGTAQQPEQQAGEWFIGKPIRAVEFVGLDTVDEGELRPIVDPYLGQPFEFELYFEMEGALYATELFEVLEADAAEGDEERIDGHRAPVGAGAADDRRHRHRGRAPDQGRADSERDRDGSGYDPELRPAR